MNEQERTKLRLSLNNLSQGKPNENLMVYALYCIIIGILIGAALTVAAYNTGGFLK